MKPQERQTIDLCSTLMTLLTTCLKPVYKENRLFMMLTLGYGDAAIKVSYDKQTALPETDMDNIKMSLYVFVLGVTMQYFSQGKLPDLVEEWKKTEDLFPEDEKSQDIVLTTDDLWLTVSKSANENPVSVFIEEMAEKGLMIIQTVR